MGRWNVSDTSSKLLVGIGSSDTDRKNGFKVSSTGQGYFASDVYANDSKKLATEEYVNIRVPAWTSEDEGKVLKIVNGTPTWVAE
jgi:hypothetical protein